VPEYQYTHRRHDAAAATPVNLPHCRYRLSLTRTASAWWRSTRRRREQRRHEPSEPEA